MCGKRLYDWKTIPIRCRTRFAFGSEAEICSPFSRIEPALISSSRLMQRRRVDFPLPDAPIRLITSCGSTARLMLRSTRCWS
jgi:hypothetical protein